MIRSFGKLGVLVLLALLACGLVYSVAVALVVPADRLERDRAERDAGIVTPAPTEPVAVRMTAQSNRVVLIYADGRTTELPLQTADGGIIPAD